MRLIDLTGKRFGRLTVLEKGASDKSGTVRWLCECNCGEKRVVRGNSLKAGGTKSCGCLPHPHFIDLAGKKFGKLTVIKRTKNTQSSAAKWICRCECGEETIATTSILNSGKKISCGCAYMRDLTGRRFGKLTIIDRAPNKGKKVTWNCRCDCGNKTKAATSDLMLGKRVTCGCVQTKHLGSRTRLYRIWTGMKNRCSNPNSVEFKWYGGRGISICQEWLDDFTPFRDWAMANGYKSHLSIDRVDNDGNYRPSNCQWITVAENTSKAQKGRPWAKPKETPNDTHGNRQPANQN